MLGRHLTSGTISLCPISSSQHCTLQYRAHVQMENRASERFLAPLHCTVVASCMSQMFPQGWGRQPRHPEVDLGGQRHRCQHAAHPTERGFPFQCPREQSLPVSKGKYPFGASPSSTPVQAGRSAFLTRREAGSSAASDVSENQRKQNQAKQKHEECESDGSQKSIWKQICQQKSAVEQVQAGEGEMSRPHAAPQPWCC